MSVWTSFSCFDKQTVEDILDALEKDGSEWALQQIEVNFIIFFLHILSIM